MGEDSFLVVEVIVVSPFILMLNSPGVVNLLQDVFRPFPGYIEVRLIKKEAKSGRSYALCFVDFENPLQATIALHTLQVFYYFCDFVFLIFFASNRNIVLIRMRKAN